MSAPDPLTRALLPVLIHKLGNATQLLTGMNAMLALDGGHEHFDRHAQASGEGQLLVIGQPVAGARSRAAGQWPEALTPEYSQISMDI